MKKLIVSILFLTSFNLFAQSVLLSENFAGGIPATWTNTDLNGGVAVWTWCNNPASGTGDCPSIFADANNMQTPFASTTATNGFVNLDSDGYGDVIHESALTIPALNCSAASAVWIQFQTHIGVYTYDADTNAVVRVSTDGINWTKYQIFHDLTTGERWSANPEFASLDISETAAGQSNVLIQFYWYGSYEYIWNIDDIVVYNGDPRPANDLRVNTNFYAIAPNIMTPKSQVEPFGFIADIANTGSSAQNNVNLNISIKNNATNTVIYTEDLAYGTVIVDTTVENHLFAGEFTPPSTVAHYTGTYTISAQNPDANPADNSVSFDFFVTDTLFAKENGATRNVGPAASNWDAAEAHGWAYGNSFYVKNGENLFSRSAVFSIVGNANVAGRIVAIGLYKWTDTNNDGNAGTSERERLGLYEYTIVGNESYTNPISVPIYNVLDESLPIQLESETNYIVTMEYLPTDQVDLFFGASGAYDFGAMVFRSDSLEAPRYAGMLGINADLTQEDFSSLGFGRNLVPFVRWSVGADPTSSTKDNVLNDNNIIKVTPNPANDVARLYMQFENPQSTVNIKIVDIQGKVVYQNQSRDIKERNMEIPVANLASGSYSIHVATNDGFRTVKLIINR